MAVDELSSITGMEEKHRRALARRQITTLRGLAAADQDVIYRAMGSIKPRPDLQQIAQWQGEARSRLGEAPGGLSEAPGGDEASGRPDEAAVDTVEWHPVASFAVVFAQRRVGGTWERRIEAERTEVEPERGPEVWSGWECDPICGWMMGQLGQAGRAEPGEPGQDGGGQTQPAAGGPPGSRRARASRAGDAPSCASTAPRSPTRPEVPTW